MLNLTDPCCGRMGRRTLAAHSISRLTSMLAVAVVCAAALPGAASADPTKHSSFPAVCDGRAVEFVTNGSGEITPAHVIGSTEMFITQSFHITFEGTPTGGTFESVTEVGSRPNPHGDLVTCSIDATESSEAGTFHAFGTVTGFFTPASRRPA